RVSDFVFFAQFGLVVIFALIVAITFVSVLIDRTIDSGEYAATRQVEPKTRLTAGLVLLFGAVAGVGLVYGWLTSNLNQYAGILYGVVLTALVGLIAYRLTKGAVGP
ncbi:MAG TPA: hypothetical protein VEY07_04710, partial [Thermoplasmata archaeon]|nr:hypothetical protein [Thermoplasmata archaeon]